MTKKVTGIGGIFFKVKDPDATKTWYAHHLGLHVDRYGTAFEWRSADHPDQKGFSQWSPMKDDTSYFQPSTKDFMVNYRVENLLELLEELKMSGVRILDEVEEFEYGKFVHILDPDGHAIELWEPNDEVYDQLTEGRTKS